MNSIIFSVVVVCVTVGSVVAFVLGYHLLQSGQITIGTVFLFVTYTNMLGRPMREITMQIQEFQQAGAGISRVYDLFSIKSTIQDGPGAAIPTGPLQVEFRPCAFRLSPPGTHSEGFQRDAGTGPGARDAGTYRQRQDDPHTAACSGFMM